MQHGIPSVDLHSKFAVANASLSPAHTGTCRCAISGNETYDPHVFSLLSWTLGKSSEAMRRILSHCVSFFPSKLSSTCVCFSASSSSFIKLLLSTMCSPLPRLLYCYLSTFPRSPSRQRFIVYERAMYAFKLLAIKSRRENEERPSSSFGLLLCLILSAIPLAAITLAIFGRHGDRTYLRRYFRTALLANHLVP